MNDAPMPKELKIIRRERNRLWKKYSRLVRGGYSALPRNVLDAIRELDAREEKLTEVAELFAPVLARLDAHPTITTTYGNAAALIRTALGGK
jgi:hypothetical protein